MLPRPTPPRFAGDDCADGKKNIGPGGGEKEDDILPGVILCHHYWSGGWILKRPWSHSRKARITSVPPARGNLRMFSGQTISSSSKSKLDFAIHESHYPSSLTFVDEEISVSHFRVLLEEDQPLDLSMEMNQHFNDLGDCDVSCKVVSLRHDSGRAVYSQSAPNTQHGHSLTLCWAREKMYQTRSWV